MSYFSSRYTHVYEPNPEFYRFKARRLVQSARLLHQAKMTSFLDLGSGCGDLAEGMHQEFHLRVAGIERDLEMTRLADGKNIGEFKAQNLLDPVSSFYGQFDLISAFEVFEHLEHADHAKALALYSAYATHDAIGAILVPNAAHPFLGGWISWSDYTHRTCFTPESLGQMLRDFGVQEARIVPWYSAGSPALLACRKLSGEWMGKAFKLLCSTLTTIPDSKDPFFSDALPFSSHILAVFKIPKT